ncbi:MAG: cytochrome c3 family protein [Nitrospinota bacterium]
MNGRVFIVAVLLPFMIVLTLSRGLAVEGDVVFKREGGETGTPAAVFPHWIHRIRYKCYTCHPAMFKMKAGADKVSMEAILEGKFCGACHNGKIAWPVTFKTCGRCHAVTK